jgi:hypothetical protein
MSNRSTLVLTTLLAAIVPSCMVAHHDSEFALRLDDALDESEVSLAEALAVPDHALRDARLIAGELDPSLMIFEAELWDGDSLLRASIDLDGDLRDIADDGWDDRADIAAGVAAGADVSIYDAIEIAEDFVDDSRAFEVAIVDPFYQVELLADFDIYIVWISPQTGEVVDVDVEDDYGHHEHCRHVCW